MNDIEERSRWMASLRQKAGDSEKNWWTVFLLSLFLGWFGVDRFYLGNPIMASLKFLSFGGVGFWWLIDLLLLYFNKTHDGHGGLVRRPF
jgi:TM2 domain-containing membrane protein YozV